MLYALIQRIYNRLLGLDTVLDKISGLRLLALKLAGEKEIADAERHAEVIALLKRLLVAVEPAPAVKFVFTVELDGQITTGVERMKITDSQMFTASIQPTDAKGNPASVQAGSIVWAGPDFLKITPSEDGLSAEVKANGPLGSGQVSVTADADLGDGVVTINGTLQVDVVAGQATGLSINTNDPTEQPAAATV